MNRFKWLAFMLLAMLAVACSQQSAAPTPAVQPSATNPNSSGVTTDTETAPSAGVNSGTGAPSSGNSAPNGDDAAESDAVSGADAISDTDGISDTDAFPDTDATPSTDATPDTDTAQDADTSAGTGDIVSDPVASATPTTADPIDADKQLNDWIPQGWTLLQMDKPALATGDLNKDGIDDVAAVIEQIPSDDHFAPPRALMILFGTDRGGYTLSTIAGNVILRADEGGIFGDPFNGLRIERGAVVVSDYGGSNWRWYNTYRFRYQDDDWYLIGITSGSYFAPEGPESGEEEDYNLVTGDYIIKYRDENGNVVTKRGNRGKEPLTRLSEFGSEESW